MHPALCNHVVLTIVFDYLQVEDLKQCRLVMKHWDNLATPFLLSKCVIAVNADETENLIELRRWMESPLWFASSPQGFPNNQIQSFKSLNCDRITHHLYPNLIATRVLGPWIRSFTVSHWWGNEQDLTLADYEDLLLRRCPNLEEINISASHKFKAPNAANFLLCAEDVRNRFKLRLKTIIVTGMDDEPDVRFWRIMALSPELKSFKVTCLIHETFWKPGANLLFNAVMNLEFVSCIRRLLSFYPNLSELTIKYPDASVVKWILKLWTQLERLTISLKEGGDTNWTIILTGGDGNNFGTLADMKMLQSLDLKLIGQDQGEADDDKVLLFPFTDELIFKGLICLPNLQHVSVRGHLISPEAIAALREAALPFCYIDISQPQKDGDGDSS